MAVVLHNSFPVSTYTEGFGASVGCSTFCICPAAATSTGVHEAVGVYVCYNRVVKHLCTPSAYVLSVVYDGFNLRGNDVTIWANDVVIFNSGCVTGSHSTTVTVPAGTIKLEYQMDGACNMPGEDGWSLIIDCA